MRIPTQLVREAVAFLNPNRDLQQTQALTENEDAAQTTEIIQEAYDQAVEETQGGQTSKPLSLFCSNHH